MKIGKMLLAAALCTGLAACGSRARQTAPAPARGQGVEVLYFHGRQRCATCVAIERETEAVIDGLFAEAVGAGELELRVIDIAQADNEAIADKYGISWSSLVIVKYENGNEQAENLTEFAFANARNRPETFRRGLTEKINEGLDTHGVAANNRGE